MTAIAIVATLIAGPTTPAPGPGLVDAVRMASAVQWNAGRTWNETIAAGEVHVSAPSPAATTRPTSSTLASIRECESGGNYTAVSSNGMYRGGYQFDHSTWASIGGTGDPALATPAEQDARAQILYDQRGPTPWPVCGR